MLCCADSVLCVHAIILALTAVFAAVFCAAPEQEATVKPPAAVSEARSAVVSSPALVGPRVLASIDKQDSSPAERPTESTLVQGRRVLNPESSAGLLDFADELDMSGNEGSLWLGPLLGNGGRDVLIYIPAGADPKADFRLVFHFHGTYSEHIEHRAPGLKKRRWVGWNRLQQAIDGADELQAQKPENIALIYPISAGKRMEPEWRGWSNKAYDRMWMQPAGPGFVDDFGTLLVEVKHILRDSLGVHASKLPRRVTVQGHSAGGIALWNIARRDEGQVGEYIFLDAGFHLWADGCYAEILAHQSPARVVLVIRDGGIADPMKGPNAWCVEHPALVNAWPEVADRCADAPKSRPKVPPAGGKMSCATWQKIVEGWPALEPWCAHMANDMRDVEGVFVHRTKVSHGDQLREFFGGLNIPIPKRAATADLSAK